jgi:hypothetical protein
MSEVAGVAVLECVGQASDILRANGIPESIPESNAGTGCPGVRRVPVGLMGDGCDR